MKILIIGESCLDVFIYGKVERLEPAAPVPVVTTMEIKKNGGMAMNVKNNFLSLGVRPDIVTNKNWETITKTRIVEKKTNHMFLRWDEADKKYGRVDLKNINFSIYDAVVISDYNKGFITKKEIKEISNLHDLVFLDTKKPIGKWAEKVAFIKINNYELSKSLNISNEIKNKLIITLGPDGASFGGKNYSVDKVEVKDLSGAGDSFLAALCVGFCKTKNINEAIIFANKCATAVVQKKGVATV